MATITTNYACGHSTTLRYGHTDEVCNMSILCPSCKEAEKAAKKASAKTKTYYVVDTVQYYSRRDSVGTNHVIKVTSSAPKYEDETLVTTIKAISIEEAREIWNKKSMGPSVDELTAIAQKVAPTGEHGEIVDALADNFAHKGIVYETWLRGEELTANQVYSVVVAHLRHTETDYDTASERGDSVRESYNDHDTAKAIMGWE